MNSNITVNLHKLAVFANFALPLLAIGSFGLGYFVSFYFHFLTVFFLILTTINFFYRHIQKEHTILSNFGILGQARYIMESIGPELRQYFFANDIEERPFNRRERTEVYQKSKNVGSTASFGSMENYDNDEIKIRHSMYPLDADEIPPYRLVFGEERGIARPHTITQPVMISAMSFGSLGKNAVRALARGAKKAGISMNTGEGGFPKYHLKEGCDLIFQMGTAKFGVRTEDGALDEEKLKELVAHEQIKMIEIKLSQGAKPGKGGLLPKEKITTEIAKLRGIPKGKDAKSPTHHSECTDAATTLQFLKRIQDLTGIPVGFKLCIGNFKEFREFVREMKTLNIYPDFLAIDGAEGGTGAAPRAFIDAYGMPLFPALQGVTKILTEESVRNRLKIIAAGKLISPGSQMVAYCLGADAIYSARGFLLSLGCIQALECSENTCPTGITTHDPKLQSGLDIGTKSLRIYNYIHNLENDFYQLLAATGKRTVQELSVENLYIPSSTTLIDEADDQTTQLPS